MFNVFTFNCSQKAVFNYNIFYMTSVKNISISAVFLQCLSVGKIIGPEQRNPKYIPHLVEHIMIDQRLSIKGKIFLK